MRKVFRDFAKSWYVKSKTAIPIAVIIIAVAAAAATLSYQEPGTTEMEDMFGKVQF